MGPAFWPRQAMVAPGELDSESRSRRLADLRYLHAAIRSPVHGVQRRLYLQRYSHDACELRQVLAGHGSPELAGRQRQPREAIFRGSILVLLHAPAAGIVLSAS